MEQQIKDTNRILVVSFQSLTKNSAGGMARLGYFVSEQLHKRGLLNKFVVFSKGMYDTPFPTVPVSKLSRYVLFVLNKLNNKFKFSEHKFRLLQEHLYDIFCVQHIHAGIDILFTTNVHLKRSFKKAKKLGIEIIYVPANPEENYIYDLVCEEQKLLGINKPCPYTYKPRLNFYNESIKHVDTVVATYPTVYESYAASNRDYQIKNIIGHLKPDFDSYTYKGKDFSGKYNVVYIATTVALKGLQYLLQAWEKLQKEHYRQDIELHIVGRIEEGVQLYIDQHYSDLHNVTYAGRVQSIPDYLGSMHLCIVPSLTDGGPYVALEATHYGIPVVMTENCGSAELLSREQKCCEVIPIRDADAIKNAILWAYNNKEDAEKMGLDAKQQLDNYGMNSFILKITKYLEARIEEKND